MIRSRLTIPTLAIFAPLFLAACSDTAPTAPAPVALLHRSPAPRPQLAYCPSNDTFSASRLIGPEGGSVAVAGHRIDIPSGGVARPTRITLRAPAGLLLRLDITAGRARHYNFQKPARVTISYDRCRRQHDERGTPEAWYFDPATGQPLEDMDASVDRLRRTVTFTTDHLSTYIVLY